MQEQSVLIHNAVCRAKAKELHMDSSVLEHDFQSLRTHTLLG